MPIQQFKPTSPGRRGSSGYTFEELTKKKPEKSLTVTLKKNAGRGNRGSISVRHRGGGAKRKLRIIDWKRERQTPAQVTAVEYDPNRSARILLLQYEDGEKAYILAPVGVKVGDSLQSGVGAEIKPGNALPLKNIPQGTLVHNIELYAGRGAQMVRSAGGSAQLMAKDGDMALLRLPSGEMRRVRAECTATIGQVGNVEHNQINLGKAGRNRHRGKRPTVRGSAMNPVDHPHGGGEGKAPVGLPGPKTPWGKPARGYRTRNNKRTDKFIVRRRTK